MENRNGLVVDVELVEEAEAALRMLERSTRIGGGGVGADRGYDRRWFESECRLRGVRLYVGPQAQHW